MFFKALKERIRENRERFAIPKGVQDVIPVHGIYADGIFLVRRGGFWGENKYSKTYKFQDINYAVASREDKERNCSQYITILR